MALPQGLLVRSIPTARVDLVRGFPKPFERVVPLRHTAAAQRKIWPATWRLNTRIHALETIPFSRFPPAPPCNVSPLPHLCPRLDREAPGSCARRGLRCLAAENLPPLRADLERCVPLHDICADLGTHARGRLGPGHIMAGEMIQKPTRGRLLTALRLAFYP
jgi:hypothetical protein